MIEDTFEKKVLGVPQLGDNRPPVEKHGNVIARMKLFTIGFKSVKLQKTCDKYSRAHGMSADESLIINGI